MQEIITRPPPRARCLFVLDTELPCENERRGRNHIVLPEISCLLPQSQEESAQTVQGCLSKRVRTHSGLTMRRLLIVQKPTGSQEAGCPTSNRRNSIGDGSKWPSPKNGGTVRWNVTATGGTCTIKLPMARKHTRQDLVCKLTDFGSHSGQQSVANPCPQKTSLGCIRLVKRCFPESSWFMSYVRGERMVR